MTTAKRFLAALLWVLLSAVPLAQASGMTVEDRINGVYRIYELAVPK